MKEPRITSGPGMDEYTIADECTQCGKTVSVVVPGPNVFRYHQGAFVQDAFPMISADDRECLFISGMCGDCWNNLFGDDEEEEDTWATEPAPK